MKNDTIFDSAGRSIVERTLSDEVEASYLEYAYSVIHSRALPDARDGFKPVHRRILYSMAQMGLPAGGSHMKSARIVGDCMGKYHPHGDSAIYDAMVRMAQDFALNTPFVDGKGNWGSADDSAAASRYTEARMASWAELMVDELKEDTVDFRPNYDGSLNEPVVLPAAIPNLLVNGSTGIAVGMSTNMIPHNLSEVLAAARWLLTHPGATLDKLMEFVPGPDLPTGGLLLGADEVRRAYETGRGVVRLRARVHIEDLPGSRGRKQIVFTELPYGVGTEKIIDSIKKELGNKRLQGIADVKDLTDRTCGTRLVVETKVGVNPDVLLAGLYKYTPLESSFGIINLTLVDGQPQQLGLKPLLEVFLRHRVDVVRRKFEYRRNKMVDRLHLVDGLLVALVDIDKVIALVRAADDQGAARDALMKTFALTDVQAQYILDTPLRRLTKYDYVALESEAVTLRASIAEADNVLSDETVLRAVVGKELDTIRGNHPCPRKTTLMEGDLAVVLAADTVSEPLEVPDTACEVSLTTTGLLVRSNNVTVAEKRVKHDSFIATTGATTRGTVLVVTSQGRAVKVGVVGLPVAVTPSGGGGMPVAEVVELGAGETVVGLVPYDGDSGIVYVGTARGVVKAQIPSWPQRGDSFTLIGLRDDDSVVAARWVEDGAVFTFVTSQAQLLVGDVTTIRAQGSLSGGGVAGMKLSAEATILGFTVLTSEEAANAMVVTSNGTSTKVTPLSRYPLKGRGGAGVRCQRFLSGGGQSLVIGYVGVNPRGSTVSGVPLSLPAGDDRRDGSGELGALAPDMIGRPL